MELTKEDFIGDKYDEYGRREYYKYKKLTNEQLNKIEDLKDGEKIKWLYRDKLYDGKVICKVTKLLNGKLLRKRYSSYPYDVRIELKNGREFWTRDIDKIYRATKQA